MPGTTIREEDQSQYTPGDPSSYGGMIATAERGPVDQPTLITSWAQFLETFGDLLPDSYGAYCFKQFLDDGNAGYFMRTVAHDGSNEPTSDTAEVTLQTVGGTATAAKAPGTVAGLLEDGVRTWAFQVGDKLFASTDAAATAGVTFAANAAVKALSDAATHNVTDGDWFSYRAGKNGDLGPLRRVTFAGVDAGAATIAQLLANLGAQMFGARVSAAANVITITSDKRGSAARLEFVGDSAAGAILAALGLAVEVVVPTAGSNVADIDYVTITELETLLEAAQVGISVTLAADGKIEVNRTVTGLDKTVTIDGGDANKIAGAAVLGLTTGQAYAGTNSSPIDTLLVKASSPGTWANGATGGVKVAAGPAPNNTADRFYLSITRAGEVVALQDDLSMDPEDERYVRKVFENNAWVEIEDLDAYATLASYADSRPAEIAATSLTGGLDGLGGLDMETDFIGDSAAKTGLYAWDNVRDVAFLGAPGNTARGWIDALAEYCETRGDVLAVHDVPETLTPAQVRDFRMATGGYAGDGDKFVSTYGAGYHPWIRIKDPKSKLQKFVPVMGQVFACYARTDRDKTWFAPAGVNRGRLTSEVRGLRADLSKADQKVIYDAGINPIVNDPDFGFIINGQKTLAGVASKRDRINVRRLLIYMRIKLLPLVRPIAEFEPNDQETWDRLASVVEPFLETIEDGRGLNRGTSRFICDKTTNTGPVIAEHKLLAKIVIQPTDTAEDLEFVLTLVGNDASLDLAA